ncbi:hypothetical protein [Dokdonella soli]|uniref:hypothetical protein n=1 Tax=Dokdonella soli TaxID=529810 RepID=UPI0036D27D11
MKARLLSVLDPDVVLRADAVAVLASASRQGVGAPKLAPEVRGAAAVADTFLGRARFAQAALVNGAMGAMWPRMQRRGSRSRSPSNVGRSSGSRSSPTLRA